MDPLFLRALDATKDVHEMLPYDETETNTCRLKNKPVLETRLIDDMTTLAHWQKVTPHIDLSISDEVRFEGRPTLRMTCPANLHEWEPQRLGRIYCEPSALRVIDREDWREWNRLSIWIYPAIHGMKSITLRLQPHNDGALKSPDRWERTGAHNFALKPYEWNHVTLEIPMVPRDCVTGVSIDYDMVGHENDSDDTLTWFLSRLELQKVNADKEEGWAPRADVISISGSGYQTFAPKCAVMSAKDDPLFRVIETRTGREVYKGNAVKMALGGEEMSVMDFSAVTMEGDYILLTNGLSSRTIHVYDDVWEPSVWKVLNFYLCERCGMEVKGKHRACHTDLLLVHGDQKIVANGGWHDAADLAQGMGNTANGTAALFLLADSLKDRRPRLYARVLEEARWGLDYVLKVRFGDGWRSDYSSTSIWMDGVIGTNDDVLSYPTQSPYNNLVSCFAEALGAYTLRKEDEALSAYALRIAMDDFKWALHQLARAEQGDETIATELFEVKTFAAATSAAAALVRAGRTEYAEDAAKFARLLIECQESSTPDWDTPLSGFYYTSRAHELPLHHAHHSFEQYTAAGLEILLNVLPDHKDAPLWRAAMERSSRYYKTIAEYTAPYGLLPEGVYWAGEAETHPEETLRSIIWGDDLCLPDFRRQVENGICLDHKKGVYLRVFPVWFSFRGNCNVQLSEAVCAASAARVTNDLCLHQIAVQQMEWIVGRNPFAQSLIFGEGYEWTDEYTVQPGTTVGQMPVGMQTYLDHDCPWWPQVATATYKEVWIESANKWMWLAAYTALPALVTGTCPSESVTFANVSGGAPITVTASALAHEFSVELPAGTYRVSSGSVHTEITVLSSEKYTIRL